MSQTNRLSNGGRIDRNKVLTFSFNGQTYKGFEGDTLAAALLAITPGPGIAYVVARTVAGGKAEGIASSLGTALGGMVHVLAAALGLSLLIAQSALAYALVQYLGAAYLLYLGIRLLTARAGSAAAGGAS